MLMNHNERLENTRRMRYRIVFPLAITFICMYAPSLFARSAGTYIGVGLAKVTVHIADMTPETLPYSYVYTGKPLFFRASQANTSPNSTWTVFGGYTFNRYLTLEASYLSLGDFERDASNRGLADINEISKLGLGTQPPGIAIYDIDRLKLEGYGLTALFTYPATNYIYLLGKLGAVYWKGTLDRTTTFFQQTLTGTKIGTLMETETGTGFSPLFGVGIRIDISRGFSVRAEYSRISSVGSGMSTGKSEANVSSLSAQVNF
jgi:hypothetical protein